MNITPKTVRCDCGQEFILERSSIWCNKCGKRVFYHEKDKRGEKFNSYYMYVVVFGVITFLTYIFVELILVPVSKI